MKNGRKFSCSPVTQTLGRVFGSQHTLWPWVPCVPCGLWGPQAAQNYIWGPHLPMWGRWVHGGLLTHTTQGCFWQCATHHAPAQHRTNHKLAAKPGRVLVYMHDNAGCLRGTFLRLTALAAFLEMRAQKRAATTAAASTTTTTCAHCPAVTDRHYEAPIQTPKLRGTIPTSQARVHSCLASEPPRTPAPLRGTYNYREQMGRQC